MDHARNPSNPPSIPEGLEQIADFLERTGLTEAAQLVSMAALSVDDQIREAAVRAGNVQPFRAAHRRVLGAISGGHGNPALRIERARAHARHRTG